MYRYHSEGAFALHPIMVTQDKKNMKVEFHWLQREVRSPHSTVDLTEKPTSSRGLTPQARDISCTASTRKTTIMTS